MATYASLTPAQQADLASYDTFLRGTFLQLSALYRNINASVWSQFDVTTVAPIVQSLGATELIPNSTGLANAVPLTQAQFAALEQALQDLNAEWTANFGTIVAAIGTTNATGA